MSKRVLDEKNDETFIGYHDVFTRVSLYGLHNQQTLHSFCVLKAALFVPTPCTVCQQIVVPLINASQCLRCHKYCHRSCAKDVKEICDGFTIKTIDLEQRMLVARKHDSSRNNYKYECENQSVQINIQLMLDSIVSKITSIPLLLVIISTFFKFFSTNIIFL